MSKKEKKNLIRILLSAFLILLSILTEKWSRPVSIVLFAASYLIVGYDILIRAWKGIRRGQPFNENFLMAVATVGAIALGEFTEGAAVMIFYQIGELFESIAVGKSRKNISDLMDIRPDYANLRQEDGTLERVDPDEVEVGTEIVVKPGEKIPIDGVITEGSSSLDTAALTGESRLTDVGPGNKVLSGSINMNGVLTVRTEKEFGESTASKILDLVENASSSKSRPEDFISKFARIYTPAVCYSALALAVVPPVIRMIIGLPADWHVWIYRALTFLVISCPCALVISIPLAFFGGLGGASNAGILIKGSNYMEPLAQAKTVVFDKTGTITKGVFEVAGVHHCPIEDERLIEYAALSECYSSHPISVSLQKAYGQEPDSSRVSDVHEISGEGVTAVVDGHRVVCGNEKLMRREKIEAVSCRSVGTVIHVALDGEYAGHILIADVIKPNAESAMETLKKIGVQRTVMLTGDNDTVAKEVARITGVDEFHSGLLPGDKVSRVEEYLSGQGKRESLLFVGDGINDAPVLARADVGFAMGAIGSDSAIEAADVVIMNDDLSKIPQAIKIARKCIRIVYENIVFAIGVKVLCLLLGAFGIAGMWAAIFADVGVMVLAVLNAVRALYVKNL